MRIGIDCRTILNPESGERAGVGYYTFELVRSLLDHDQENEYVLFFDYRTNREAAQTFDAPNATIRFFPFSSYGKFLPFAYSHLLVAAALLKEHLDVLHGPANVIPLGYTKPAVITLHDLAIYKHPEWFPTQVFSTRLLVPQSVKRAKRVIAVSEATRQDLHELFNVPTEKVDVVYEAADTTMLELNDRRHDVRKHYGLPERYVLFVGSIEPRKNLHALLKAWERLQLHKPDAVRGMKLVLAGGVGFGGHDIAAHIKQMQLDSSVTMTGYVSHNHKILLMQQAAAFVYPSFYEGFGLPVVEAMQLGLPVVTSDTTSLKEITNDAALLVDPRDVDALADALKTILSDRQLAEDLRRRGKEQAKKFSWEKVARETVDVYRRAHESAA